MKRENLLFYIGYCLISVFLIIMTAYLSRGCCFAGDDLWFASLRPYENVFSPLNPFGEVHGDGYFGYWFLTLSVYSLPNFVFHINPSDVISVPFGILRGFLCCIIFFVLLMFFKHLYKGRFFYLVLYLSFAFLFFFFGLNSFIIVNNYNFCRYFMSLIFAGYFWYFLYICLNCEKPNKLQFVLACICAYITGMTVEIEIFLTLMLLCLIVVFCLFSNLKESLKQLAVPSLIFLFSMILFTNSSGYKEVSLNRGMNNISITFEAVKEYLSLFFQNCVLQGIIIWLLFFAFCIGALLIAKRKKELKELVFPVFFEISLLAVMFSLILCGKTFEGTNSYYLTHPNILFLYWFLTSIPVLMFLGYILKNTENKKTKVTAAVIILICACILPFKTQYSRASEMRLEKMRHYTLEKITLFEYYKSGSVSLPQNIVNNYKPEIMLEYGLPVFTNYLAHTYHLKTINQTPFEFTEDAIEKFYDMGGSFGKKEIEKLKFQNLNDTNFILKKQDDELSKEEMTKILQE